MITVGIPTVNGSHRLERCLSHIFKDNSVSRFNAEVLVVDDGSSDFSLEKNREYCQKFNVKLIEHSGRKGVATGWNTIVKNSNNDIILLLNDDIEVNPYWLDSTVYTLKNNEWLGLVGLNALEGARPELFPVFPTYMESKIQLGSAGSEILSPRGFAFAFRKKDWQEVNGFDENYFCFFEEIDFALTLLVKKNLRSTILSYPLLHHYHAETTTTVLKDPKEIFEISKSYFETKWNTRWENLRENISFILKDNKNYITKEWNTNLAIWG